jgi:hypothetical protein
VNVQVLVLLPPLEHAPDQMASRPFETLSVMDVPVLNVADPVLPTDTLVPAGFETTRSPLRPDALTVNVACCAGGVTVSVVVRVTPAALAVMVTAVEAATVVVVTWNVALGWPCATVTLGGTDAAALLLDSATVNPPAGAAAVRPTMPVDDDPPTTLVGFTETALSDAGAGGGFTVSVTDRETPPYAPVIVTKVVPVTCVVATGNVALVAPAAMVTLEGTLATPLLLVSVTTAPPEGAALEIVAVPWDPLPPVTLVGLRTIEESVGPVDVVPCGVKRRVEDQAPATPAALTPRTRQK